MLNNKSVAAKEKKESFPCKQLVIKVLELKKLTYKGNVFCTIELLDNEGKRISKSFKTDAKKTNNNSIITWNDSFVVQVNNCSGLRVTLNRKQKLMTKVLGQVSIKFQEPFIKSEEIIDDNFDLMSSKGKTKQGPTLGLHLQYLQTKLLDNSPKINVVDSIESSDDSQGKRNNFKNLKFKNSAYVVIKTLPDPTGDYPIAREGPRTTELVPFSDSGITITNDEQLILENCNNKTEIATCNAKLRGNCWYYEVKIEKVSEESKIYVGWISDRFHKWDDEMGWFASSKGEKKKGTQLDPLGETWSSGDVIGCGMDLINGHLMFIKNGNQIKKAFDGVKRGKGCGEHFVPAFGLDKDTKLTVNFGVKPFLHIPQGYYSISFNLGTEDRAILETLFETYTSKQDPLESETGSSDFSSSDSEIEVRDSDDDGDIPENVMSPTLQGTLKYLSEMNIDLSSDIIGILLISWKLNAKKAFTFSKEEFVIGWSVAGCKTIDQMKEKVVEWKKSVKTTDPKFYQYCGQYFQEKDGTIMTTDALRLWNYLIKEQWALFDQWILFMLSNTKSVPISVWNELPLFMEKHPVNLDAFESDKWSILFQDFSTFITKSPSNV